MDINGKPMGIQWEVNGKPKGNQWEINGKSMETKGNQWKSMETNGEPMQTNEKSMGNHWRPMGTNGRLPDRGPMEPQIWDSIFSDLLGPREACLAPGAVSVFRKPSGRLPDVFRIGDPRNPKFGIPFSQTSGCHFHALVRLPNCPSR